MAGSTVQTVTRDANGNIVLVKLVNTGDAANGSIPTVTIDAATMTLLKGKYMLYGVMAYPTVGGTAPDAADVTVMMNGLDLLGGKGVNLIHATATQDVAPYSTFAAEDRYPMITGDLTVAVANEATNSCHYTIDLIFYRP